MIVIIPLLAASIAAATEITIEAETASLSGLMKVTADGQAFNNFCINGYKNNERGWASYTVNIPQTGNYVIWGRINGRDGYTNSFFVRVDNLPEIIAGLSPIPPRANVC